MKDDAKKEALLLIDRSDRTMCPGLRGRMSGATLGRSGLSP